MLVTNLTIFHGDWNDHARFLAVREDRHPERRRRDLALFETLRAKDERLQLQRAVLRNEILEQTLTMSVEDLLRLFDLCAGRD